MTQKTKAVRKAKLDKRDTKMHEVKKLIEPVRHPMHCGVLMRKLSGVLPGGIGVTYVCAKECGAQVKGETVKA